MRGWVRIFVLAALAGRVQAQGTPDAGEILRRVSALYQGATEYDFEMEVTSLGTGRGAVSHVRFAFRAPDKYRMQGGFPGRGGDGQNMSETLLIHDGAVLWFYFLESNQYGSLPLDTDPGDKADLAPAATDRFMMARFRGAEAQGGAKLLREETLDVAGEKIACHVVEVSPTDIFWVEQKSNRVVREDRPESRTVFTTIRLNEKLPDDLFRFDPPPGAQKLEPRR